MFFTKDLYSDSILTYYQRHYVFCTEPGMYPYSDHRFIHLFSFHPKNRLNGFFFYLHSLPYYLKLYLSLYDIQFFLASGFHFVVVFFICVQNSIELFPVISHTPNFDSFHPPNENGSRGTGTPMFTPIIPALA